MRILAISDDWTHLIDQRTGRQHVVQRGVSYPPGVDAVAPRLHPLTTLLVAYCYFPPRVAESLIASNAEVDL